MKRVKAKKLNCPFSAGKKHCTTNKCLSWVKHREFKDIKFENIHETITKEWRDEYAKNNFPREVIGMEATNFYVKVKTGVEKIDTEYGYCSLLDHTKSERNNK